MSRSSRLIAGIAVTILLAACGQAGSDLTGPAGPSLNAESNPASQGGSGSTTTTTTLTTTSDGDTTVPTDTTGRGGGYSVGGN